MKFIDLTNLRFGRLLVQELMPMSFKKIRRWRCLCDCGKICYPKGQSLRSGITKSCGCLHKDNLAIMLTTHGMTKKGLHKPLLYSTWAAMKSRCYNKNEQSFKNYGGRGISVCRRWLGKDGFINFLTDMGDKPSNAHSIDRINVNGNYEPLNCRWATDEQQASNKRCNIIINYGGFSKTITCWAKELNTSGSVIKNRLKSTSFEHIYNHFKTKHTNERCNC